MDRKADAPFDAFDSLSDETSVVFFAHDLKGGEHDDDFETDTSLPRRDGTS